MSIDYDITPQRQAYLEARGYTILTACPGSGKTTSIVKKLLTVSHYCEEHYGKHTGFACLSFTNKACAELKQKYMELHDERLAFPGRHFHISKATFCCSSSVKSLSPIPAI